ncbi:MAG: site-specific DNA-methyltransferase [Planctomycetes bacterium]|nr:site-specific DNA-methyltransferase [Planctomycetota bacterium]NOG53125.1 site-specific DNA-methyltransferase [Planctomycetota bacterium]
MRAALAEIGFADALLARETADGVQIIDGHLRAELDGDQMVPVLILDVDETEAEKLLATFDPLAGLAEADLDVLRDLASNLDFEMPDLDRVVRDLLGDAGGVPDVMEVEAPEPPDDPITKPGDLWVLGNHRLLCGDSGSEADVDRLLDGAVINLANCDQPYNVRVEPRSNNAIAAGNSSFPPASKSGRMHHQSFDVARQGAKNKRTSKMRAKDRPLENDFVSDEEFDLLLHAWFGNLARVLKPGGSFYCWGGYGNLCNYPPVLKACGLYFSQAIIWHKQHPVLTRKDLMGDHEWCFYGWREGAGHKFYGPNNVTDVWSIKKVNPNKMIHLTEKPVELAARAITYSSQPGENVIDLFGGSGSTLIAAEQLDRHAFLMEIDPAYTDVIVQRWTEFTGGKPERIPSDANAVAGEKAPASADACEVENV